MKLAKISVWIFTLIVGCFADTTFVSGEVSGVWDSTGSPYYVTDSVCVPSGDSLRIGPGVKVIFQGHYKFCVDSNAVLKAIGTETDSIIFTAEDTIEGHHGIRFYRPAEGCSLSYCDISFGNANTLGDINSGHYFMVNGNSCGGGVFVKGLRDFLPPGSVDIICSKIHRNRASEHGGGIFVISGVTVTISKSVICENSSDSDTGGGGGFAAIGDAFSSTVTGTPSGTIENCIFHHNSSSVGGAIWLLDNSFAIHHCTIVSNEAYGAGGAVYSRYGFIVMDVGGNAILNSIIYNNISPDPDNPQFEEGCPRSILQAGNYIDSLFPYFADTLVYDYHLLLPSPCIDAGVDGGHFGAMTYIAARPNDDFDGNIRPIGLARDIGAYEVLDTFQCKLSIAPGWNLISVPSNNPLTTIISPDLYAYDNPTTEYFNPDTVYPGKGYWKLGMAPDSLLVPANLASFTDTLYPGWNLIGATRYAIPASEIATDPPGLRMGLPYGYDPASGYFSADILYTGMGYWFLSSGYGRITVGP